MIKTSKGSPDGLRVKTYEKGITYDIQEDLAKVFLNEMKVAVLEIETTEDQQEEIETPEDQEPEVKRPEKKKAKKKKITKKGKK